MDRTDETAALDDLIRTYGHPPCSNCGWLVWVDDFRSGDTLCNRCGSVQDRIRVAAPNYKDIFDSDGNRRHDAGHFESYSVGARVLFDCPKTSLWVTSDIVKKSPPYKRSTYLNERIKQWQCQEPEICEKDWVTIQYEWQEIKSRGVPKDYVLTKEAIRGLLKLIDDHRLELDKRPRFVRKYLVSVLSFSALFSL